MEYPKRAILGHPEILKESLLAHSSQGLPDNTLDFMEETQNAQLVSQSTLKFPKPKKSPRAKAEKIQPLIRPTVTPAASASASKPEDSASWLVTVLKPFANSDFWALQGVPGSTLFCALILRWITRAFPCNSC